MKSHSRERNGRVTFITRIIFRSGTLLKNDCNNLGQEKRKNKVWYRYNLSYKWNLSGKVQVLKVAATEFRVEPLTRNKFQEISARCRVFARRELSFSGVER